MGATAAVIATVFAAGATTASLVEQNQQIQHAKGAAQAEQTQMQAQVDAANKQTQATEKQNSSSASATQTAALAALRASMSAGSGFGGSILTGPQGTGTVAPTQGKTLLGA